MEKTKPGQFDWGYPNLRKVSNEEVENADWAGTEVADVMVDGAKLTNKNLRGAKLTRVHFSRTDLRGANLSSATLRHVRFTECRMDGMVMNRGTFDYVDVCGGSLDHADIRVSGITDTMFDGVTIREASFWRSLFHDVSFFELKVDSTNMEECLFGRVSFSGCDLTGAKLPLSRHTQLTDVRPNWDCRNTVVTLLLQHIRGMNPVDAERLDVHGFIGRIVLEPAFSWRRIIESTHPARGWALGILLGYADHDNPVKIY